MEVLPNIERSGDRPGVRGGIGGWLTDPAGPELPASDFRELLRRTDPYLGAYTVALLLLNLLRWGQPGWHVGWSSAVIAVYVAGNIIASRIAARTGNLARLEPVRLGAAIGVLALNFYLTGGAHGQYWYLFGAGIIGLSAHYLVMRIRSPLPLAFMAVTYLSLCLLDARNLKPAAIADFLAQSGFLLLLSFYLDYVMRFLLEHNARLSEGKERFQQLAENISEVFWITSADRQNLVYVSPAYERVWGRPLNDLGKRPMDWIDGVEPEDRALVLDSIRRLETRFDIEYRVRRPDGSIRHVRDRGFPVRDGAGGVVRVAGIAEDVTELKAAAQREEEQRSALVQTAKMSSLGEMAAGIAHEINNPLMIIQGKAQQILRLAREETVNRETLQVYARKIDETAGRIDHIIRGLRSFAKDDRRGPVESTPVIRILNDTLAFCEARFQSHGIALLVEPFPPSLSLECRPVQISQVLLNLLNNAFDAVESSAEKIVGIQVREVSDAIEISVTDSGAGVPPDLREKILQPFFTTKEQGRGTGLGLSISRGIAESHGGKLDLDILQPRPTKFVLTLPKTKR